MSRSKTKVGIIGAGGFTGLELLHLLSRHDRCSVELITSNEYAGQTPASIRGNLETPAYAELKFTKHPASSEDFNELDVVFLAVPDHVAQQYSPWVLKAGAKCIDLSGAFRLKNEADLKSFYHLDNTEPELLAKATYGLPELLGDKIKDADFICNPGCYPTACIIPYALLIDELPPHHNTIFFDAKSGSSGAGGRKEKDGLAYSDVYENFRAYKVSGHQHQPEIRDYIQYCTDQPEKQVRFIPHLLPMFRGLLATAQIYCTEDANESRLQTAAIEISRNHQFVRYRESCDRVNLKQVQNTNFLDFSFHYDTATKALTIVSAIDNLQKGAAGQAMQNMNLMFNFPEETGLL